MIKKFNKNILLETWDVESLEKFFVDPPGIKEFQLSKHEKIIDVKGFIESHLLTIKEHQGEPVYRAYYNRLNLLKTKLNENNTAKKN